MISREANRTPAISNGTSNCSATGHRRDQFDALAGTDGIFGPAAPGHHLAVDNDGAAARGSGPLLDQAEQGRAVVDVEIVSVHGDLHCASGAGSVSERPGRNGATVSSSVLSRTSEVTAAAVSGASRMPLR